MGAFVVAGMFLNALVVILIGQQTDAVISAETQKLINKANKNGPYLGLVIPNLFEMNPLINSQNYTSSNLTIDFQGRRFRFAIIAQKKSILVMTGMGMINAGITTQLLLGLFDIEGVVHYGVAGNANPSLNIGDVAIPKYWSHTALWFWQRYGQGPEDQLAFEANGGSTRDFGFLKFANYTINITDSTSYDNALNNIWYQPEEVFPVDSTPEVTKHAFWVKVDSLYYNISKNLEVLELEGCVNSTTCLTITPKVVTVERGASGNIYLDNADYRSFIYDKFKVSPVDMESASVALICYQQEVPFIAFRALSDLAGGGSAQSNEADTFSSLAAVNSVKVVLEFVNQLSTNSAQSNLFVN